MLTAPEANRLSEELARAFATEREMERYRRVALAAISVAERGLHGTWIPMAALCREIEKAGIVPASRLVVGKAVELATLARILWHSDDDKIARVVEF